MNPLDTISPAGPASPTDRNALDPPVIDTAHFQRHLDRDGICHLVFDSPSTSANVFSPEALRELERHVTWLQMAHDIRGVIFRSAKPRIFIAGADLHALAHASAREIEEMLHLGQRVFSQIADLPMPTVAAIHGACLGGGLEMALACRYRIASDDESTRIGLPETQLGLVPAWGGCTRLPRLIGTAAALEVILGGNAMPARSAAKMGLIDVVVAEERLLVHAVRWILDGGRLTRKREALSFIKSVASGMIAQRQSAARARGLYPALPKAIDIVSKAVRRPIETSLAAERRAFIRLIHHAETRNLIQVFFERERLKKGASLCRPPIANVVVVGAGVMGCGIAYWLIQRGLRVLLLDVNDQALGQARVRIAEAFRSALKRHRITSLQARHAADRLTLAKTGVPLDRADLIIEAATEDPALKRRIFADLVARARPDALIATNTSAIPLQTITDDPRVVGLHFFNPVHAMPLVEVVAPTAASPAAVERAAAFVRAIGKTPLVVQDRPGFLVNRILVPYLPEAAKLAHEGFNPHLIDEAMLDFGMPMGPLRLIDEVGLDVALHVGKTLAEAFPDRIEVPAFLETWVREGRLGRKTGRGFYFYDNGRPVISHKGSGDREELQRWLALLLVDEASRCLEEGVVPTAADVDIGMVLGTGFAPFRGGPLRHAEASGLTLVVGQLQRLETTHGRLFAPSRRLISLAEHGGAFYPKEEPTHEHHFTPAAAAA